MNYEKLRYLLLEVEEGIKDAEEALYFIMKECEADTEESVKLTITF